MTDSNEEEIEENPRISKDITLSDIVGKLQGFFTKQKLQIISSDDNDDKQIIRIRRIHDKVYCPPISPEFEEEGRIEDIDTRNEKLEKY